MSIWPWPKKHDDWSICRWLIVAAVAVAAVAAVAPGPVEILRLTATLWRLPGTLQPGLWCATPVAAGQGHPREIHMVDVGWNGYYIWPGKGNGCTQSGGVLLICWLLPVRWSLWIYSSKWLVVLVWLQLRHQHGALIRWFILKAGLSEMHKAQTTAFTSNKVELSERHVRLLKNPALSQRSAAAKHRADCRVPWTSSGRALFMPSRPQLCGCGSWCFAHLVRSLSLFDT